MATNGELVVAGVRPPYSQVGDQGDREAVVFVHGNPGPASDWSDLLECVGEFARGIAMDFPGYGGADRPRDRDFDYSVSGYARHLDGALAELGVNRAHIVAHDFGGPWALAWAEENPEKFASATLINTGVLIGYRWAAASLGCRATGLAWSAGSSRPEATHRRPPCAGGRPSESFCPIYYGWAHVAFWWRLVGAASG
jgi:pimeloyl-ACP methyl ester carboxylesterase